MSREWSNPSSRIRKLTLFERREIFGGSLWGILQSRRWSRTASSTRSGCSSQRRETNSSGWMASMWNCLKIDAGKSPRLNVTMSPAPAVNRSCQDMAVFSVGECQGSG